VLNLRDGKDQQRLFSENPEGAYILYYAISDKLLLESELNGKTRKIAAFIRVKLPGYEELSRISFSDSTTAGFVVCGNRKRFVYVLDGRVVNRRTENFNLVNSWPN